MVMKMEMSVEKYLERIGFAGEIKNDYATLAALQKAHLTSVPYENLDIYFGTSFGLSYEEEYDKIVMRRRGGYCFELNGLFGWLLRKLGFKTEEYFGRWLKGEVLAVPMRRHRIIRVFLEEGEFIADVGVGQRCPLTPLEYVFDKIQIRESTRYRIVKNGIYSTVQIELDGNFIDFYAFDEAPQENIDFAYPHFYCSNHPDSVFRKKIMAHRFTEYGRNSIGMDVNPSTGQSMPVLSVGQKDGSSIQSWICSQKMLDEVLKEYFGIVR